MEIRYNFKTIIVGNNNVGKSSIVKSFGDRYFDHSYHSTIGIDFSSQVIVLNLYRLKSKSLKISYSLPSVSIDK